MIVILLIILVLLNIKKNYLLQLKKGGKIRENIFHRVIENSIYLQKNMYDNNCSILRGELKKDSYRSVIELKKNNNKKFTINFGFI